MMVVWIDLSCVIGIGGWMGLVMVVVVFFLVFVFGNLFDRFGWCLVLFVVFSFFVFDYLLLVVVYILLLIFIGWVMLGMFGGSYVFVMVVVVDVLILEDCVKMFGFVSVVFGIGFVFGLVFGGLFGEWGLCVLFYVVLGMVVLNVFYGLLVFFEILLFEWCCVFDWWCVNLFGVFDVVCVVLGMMGVIVVLILW